MGVSFTPEEARALRDALRTDYAMREKIIIEAEADYKSGRMTEADAEEVIEEQTAVLAILDDADGVLRSIYRYNVEEDV